MCQAKSMVTEPLRLDETSEVSLLAFNDGKESMMTQTGRQAVSHRCTPGQFLGDGWMGGWTEGLEGGDGKGVIHRLAGRT